MLALPLLLMIFLVGCRTTISDAPYFPDPDKEVSQELRDHCYPVDPVTKKPVNVCPHTFVWLDKIYKLKDKLSVVHK